MMDTEIHSAQLDDLIRGVLLMKGDVQSNWVRMFVYINVQWMWLCICMAV